MVVEYETVNPRLLWVRFKMGMTRIFLLAAYAPCYSPSSTSELEQFWENVREVLGKKKDNERTIVCGGLNGWVSPSRSRFESVFG